MIKNHTESFLYTVYSVLIRVSSFEPPADLKRTIAVLLDDILTRLVKLEGKIELAVNASSANTSHTAAGVPALPPGGLQKAPKQEAPGPSRLGLQ